MVYTDAPGMSHSGVALRYNDQSFSTTTHIHTWLATVRGEIAEFEIRAAILGLCAARELFPEAPVLFFRDNQGARGAAARGSCRTSERSTLAAVFWNVADKLGGLLG